MRAAPLDDARKAVRQRYKEGSDLIKITATGGVLSDTATGTDQQMTDDELAEIVATAHALGRKVAAHAHGTDGIIAALRAGDAVEGVRLTERGLRSASNERDRLAGYSNLCAGLVILDRYEEALESCNTAIAINNRHWRSYNNRALAYLKLGRYSEAERDIQRGQELNPDARTLKVVKSMYLDAVDPVIGPA